MYTHGSWFKDTYIKKKVFKQITIIAKKKLINITNARAHTHMKESAWHSCLHAHMCGYTHMHSCDWPLFCDSTHAHTTATHSHDHQCTYTMWHSMKVLPQAVNLALINPSFYRNQAVNQSVPSKSWLLHTTSTSSKIGGCTLSPSLQEMFQQTLIRQAQKVCSDPTHVLHT